MDCYHNKKNEPPSAPLTVDEIRTDVLCRSFGNGLDHHRVLCSRQPRRKCSSHAAHTRRGSAKRRKANTHKLCIYQRKFKRMLAMHRRGLPAPVTMDANNARKTHNPEFIHENPFPLIAIVCFGGGRRVLIRRMFYGPGRGAADRD